MSITNDLRKYADDWGWLDEDDADGIQVILEDFADRIDAEHKHQLVEARAEGIAEGIDADFEAREHHGWVRLPVDADGVPWYRGSKVIDPQDPEGNVCTVWIAGDNTLITDDHLFIYDANKLRHHAPTAEDVLNEYFRRRVDELGDRGDCVDDDALRAWDRQLAELNEEYARRLALGGADEYRG